MRPLSFVEGIHDDYFLKNPIPILRNLQEKNCGYRYFAKFLNRSGVSCIVGDAWKMVCSSFDPSSKKCKETGMKIYQGMEVPCEVVNSPDKCKVVAMRK
jgi:hypothetical protein